MSETDHIEMALKNLKCGFPADAIEHLNKALEILQTKKSHKPTKKTKKVS